MALIALTVFFRTEMHRDSIDDAGVYAGAIFFAIVTTLFWRVDAAAAGTAETTKQLTITVSANKRDNVFLITFITIASFHVTPPGNYILITVMS